MPVKAKWRERGPTAADRGPYSICWAPDGQAAEVSLEGHVLERFSGPEAKRRAQAYVNRQLQGVI